MSPARPKASDPLPGTPVFVRFEWHGQRLPQKGEEVRLTQNRRGDLALQSEREIARVTVVSGADQRQLERIRIGAAPYIAHVVDSGGRGPQGHQISVTIFRFENTAALPPRRIAFDDRIPATIDRWEGTRSYQFRPERAVGWLADRFLLPPEPRETDATRCRIIISAAREGVGDTTSYRLHGRGVVADVHMGRETALLRRLRRPTDEDTHRILRLVYTTVEFTDSTIAGQHRASMQPWIDKLAAGQGFLALWQEYNRIEDQYLGDIVVRAGKAQFHGWERLPSGDIRFRTATGLSGPDGEPTLISTARNALDQRTELEVEAARKLPTIFSRQNPDEGETQEAQAGSRGISGHRQERHAFTGSVVDVDPAAGTITLRPSGYQDRSMPGVGGDQGIQLGQSGWLHRSYRGDQRQIERRERAFRRVLDGGTYIANLLALLEGQRIEAKPPGKHIRAESEAAWAIFGGSPTPSQRAAIDLALNTPDIAVIQGPPGTGKTDVIAAIQTRLAEQGKSYAELRGSMLLASFQHSAVEEAAARSVILGIPSDKIDRTDRGSLPLRDKLREDAVRKLDTANRDSATPRQVQSLRELNRKAAEYWLDPPDTRGTAALLEQALSAARPYIPAELAVRLGQAADRLTIHASLVSDQPVLSDAHELMVSALRGLRTTPESFADDGPRTAAKVLRRFQALPEPPGLDDRDVELLTRAAKWTDAQPPAFLDDLRVLRDRVTDHLLRPTGPEPVLTADPEITALLDETVTEMEESLRRLPDVGVHLVLQDYRESLHGDPDAVEWTLRAYTASYATTCQQADSRKMTEAKGVRSEDDVVFDTVIIDEAARANPLDLMIPMALASRRIILVGDHHQLPPMLEPDVERQVLQGGDAATDTLRKSLFQRLFEAHHDRVGPPVRRVVTLNEQFRMHEVLGQFVSESFYGGQLNSPRGSAGFAHGLPDYGTAVAAWLDVPHDQGPEHHARSTSRRAEAERVADELGTLLKQAPDLTFGAISFYADQVDLIGAELAQRGIARRAGPGENHFVGDGGFQATGDGRERLRVGSVDSFQGRQFDVVLLSMTRSAPRRQRDPSPDDPENYVKWVRGRYGHVLLINRLCVAMSRQRRLLIVVGDAAMFDAPRAPEGAAPLTEFLRICKQGGEHGRFVRG